MLKDLAEGRGLTEEQAEGLGLNPLQKVLACTVFRSERQVDLLQK